MQKEDREGVLLFQSSGYCVKEEGRKDYIQYHPTRLSALRRTLFSAYFKEVGPPDLTVRKPPRESLKAGAPVTDLNLGRTHS